MATTGGTATVARAEMGGNQYQGLMDDCPQDEHSCLPGRLYMAGWIRG